MNLHIQSEAALAPCHDDDVNFPSTATLVVFESCRCVPSTTDCIKTLPRYFDLSFSPQRFGSFLYFVCPKCYTYDLPKVQNIDIKMKALLQRVTSASVTVDNQLISSISRGILVLAAINVHDTKKEAESLAAKVLKLKMWDEEEEKGGGKVCLKVFVCDIGGLLRS